MKRTRASSLEKRRYWLYLFFIVILGAVIYSNTFNVPFIYDDVPNITENTAIQLTEINPENLFKAGFKGYAGSRPVSSISFAFNYYFHRYDVTGYHLVNLAVHVLTGIWLFSLLHVVLKSDSHVYASFTPGLVPFLAALLWLVHPLQTQAVTYTVQRMASLSAMFYVLSLFLYVKGRQEVTKSRWGYFAGCALSGILALGSKEIAATLPFFILLYEWYFLQDLRWAWLKRCLPVVAASFVLLWLLSWEHFGTNPIQGILDYYDRHILGFTITERVLTEFRVILFYIALLFFPHPSRLNLDHDFTISHTFLDPPSTLFSMFVIVGLLFLAVWTARRHRLISFSILWFFGNLVIESSVIGMEIIYEHRLYLPSMFFFLPFLILALRYVVKKGIVVAVVAVIALVFSVWTYQRNAVWNDPVSLWRDCAEKSPGLFRPHFNLANFLAKRGDLAQAVESYQRAIAIKPHRAQAHYNLANTLLRQGKLDEAAEHYRKTLRSKADFAGAETGLGVVMARQGKLDEAVKHYRKAIEMVPDDATAHHNLGFTLARQGKLDEAVKHYREAIRINPNYTEAKSKLRMAQDKIKASEADGASLTGLHGLAPKPVQAEMFLRKGVRLAQQGRLDEAEGAFREALRLDSDYAEGHYSLGILFTQKGDLGASVSHYREALRIKPGYAEAHNNLGIVLMKTGKVQEALNHFSEALRIRPGYEEAEKNLRWAKGQVGQLR